jgi:hypothetical protein
MQPGRPSDGSFVEAEPGAGGAVSACGSLVSSRDTDLASTADGVFASIDSRLRALQAASARLESQLQSQHESLGLVMDAVSRPSSTKAGHERGDDPMPSPTVSPSLRAGWRADCKTFARSRSGLQLRTSAILGSSHSASSPRASGQHVQDLVEDDFPFDTPLTPNPRITIIENADEPPVPRTSCMSAPASGIHPFSLPTVGRLMGTQVSNASQVSSHTWSEAQANLSGVSHARKNRSGRSSLHSASLQGSPRHTVTSLHGAGRAWSWSAHVQQAAGDTAQEPSGFWPLAKMKSFGNLPSSDAPGTASFVSRVNQVLAGKAEDIARAASLGTGGTLLNDEVSLPLFMLSPQSRVHVVLASLLIVTIVYTGLLSPIALAYFHGGGLSPSWSIPLHVADTLWLVFILIVFRSAIHDQRGFVVVDARRIAGHYARTWLLVDLLSAWPAFLASEGTAVYSACLVLKLLRTPRLASLISLLQKEYRIHILSPLKWGIMILLLLHGMACLWRLVQCDVGLHIASGASHHPDLYCEDGDWWHTYVSDMYWVTMTLSTVGYGDIHPYNTVARVFAIFVMFLSPIFFGSVVAALSKVIDRLLDEKVETCVATMSQFMRRHGVSLGLQRKVERGLRQALNNEVNVAPLDAELFARLSPALQRTFSFAILSSTIERFPLFKGAIHSFVAELAQAHMLVHCSAGDLVGEAGQLVEDLVFVVKGELVARYTASWADRLDVPIEDFVKAGEAPADPRPSDPASSTSTDTGRQRVLGKGAWFGEACIVGRRHVLTASLVAQGLSELAVLGEEGYVRVMRKYPAMARRHERFVEEMGSGTISLADIAWTEAPRTATWARSRK